MTKPGFERGSAPAGDFQGGCTNSASSERFADEWQRSRRCQPKASFEEREALNAQSLVSWASKDGSNGLARFDAYPKFDIGMAGWGHVLNKKDLRLGLESCDPRSQDHRMLQSIYDNYDKLKQESANAFGIHFDGVCLNDLRVDRDYKRRVAEAEAPPPPQESPAPQRECEQRNWSNPTFEHSENKLAHEMVLWASKDGDNGLARFDAYPKFDPGMIGWGHILDRRDIKLGLESTDPRSKDHEMLQMLSDNYDVLKQKAANLFGIHFDGVCLNDLRELRQYKARIDVPHPDFSAQAPGEQAPTVQEELRYQPRQDTNLEPGNYSSYRPAEAPSSNDLEDSAPVRHALPYDDDRRFDAQRGPVQQEIPRVQQDLPPGPPDAPRSQQDDCPGVRREIRARYYAREYQPRLSFEDKELNEASALLGWASKDGGNAFARFDAYPKFDPGMIGWGHILDKRDLKLGLESTDPRSTDHHMLKDLYDNYDVLKKQSANFIGIHFDGICVNDLRVHKNYIEKVAHHED